MTDLGTTPPLHSAHDAVNRTLAIGQRVRTLINLDSAEWAPEQPDIPAGSLGTVSDIYRAHNNPDAVSGYSVMLDDSVDRLSAWMDPADVEPLTN